MRERVALFGGTFDPVHRAHLFLAERARARLALNKVIFIPCRQSPHKTKGPSAGAEQRLRMLELANADRPWAEISRWELEQAEPSFSWRTAAHYREVYPGDTTSLYWILGGDQWRTIERWSRIELLAELVVFVVFPRFGELPAPKEGIPAVFLNDAMTLAATEVRQKAASLLPELEESVPDAVAAYIRRQRLYGVEPG